MGRVSAVKPIWLLCLGACSTAITPLAIDAADAPIELRSEANRRWHEAVTLVNQFLAEQPVWELPPFRLRHDPAGMRLVTEEGEQGFAVACTSWGNLVTLAGFTAQERSWGFVVGKQGDGDDVLANSFLQSSMGLRSVASLGGLILHEAVHTIEGSGTVSFWSGLRYYLLTPIYGGAQRHPHERLAYEVEARFHNWARQAVE